MELEKKMKIGGGLQLFQSLKTQIYITSHNDDFVSQSVAKSIEIERCISLEIRKLCILYVEAVHNFFIKTRYLTLGISQIIRINPVTFQRPDLFSDYTFFKGCFFESAKTHQKAVKKCCLGLLQKLPRIVANASHGCRRGTLLSEKNALLLCAHGRCRCAHGHKAFFLDKSILVA